MNETKKSGEQEEAFILRIARGTRGLEFPVALALKQAAETLDFIRTHLLKDYDPRHDDHPNDLTLEVAEGDLDVNTGYHTSFSMTLTKKQWAELLEAANLFYDYFAGAADPAEGKPEDRPAASAHAL